MLILYAINKLSNGMTIRSYQLPHTHSITIGLYVKVGSRYENVRNNGITHFLEHLHFRRIGCFSQKEIYFRMESMGTTLRAKTFKYMMYYSMKIRPNYFNDAIKLIIELINTYYWSEDEFNKEKQVVLDQIQERDSFQDIQPYVDKLIWKQHPLSFPIMGTENTVSRLTLSDLVSFKKKYFIPSNMFLVITGCFKRLDLDFTIKEAEKTTISNLNCITNYLPVILKKRTPDVLFVKRSWDYLEVRLMFDIDYNKISYEKIVLLNCVLGEGVGSKLQLRIREEECLTSNIYSYIENYEDVAVLNIGFSSSMKNMHKILCSIVDVLKSIKKEISKEELGACITFNTDNLWFWLDDPEELNYQIVNNIITLNREFSLENEVEKFSKIYAEQLAESANYVFKKQNLSIVIMGDCKNLNKKDIENIFSSF